MGERSFTEQRIIGVKEKKMSELINLSQHWGVVSKLIRETDWSERPEELEKLYAEEQNGKNRGGVLKAIKKYLPKEWRGGIEDQEEGSDRFKSEPEAPARVSRGRVVNSFRLVIDVKKGPKRNERKRKLTRRDRQNRETYYPWLPCDMLMGDIVYEYIGDLSYTNTGKVGDVYTMDPSGEGDEWFVLPNGSVARSR